SISGSLFGGSGSSTTNFGWTPTKYGFDSANALHLNYHLASGGSFGNGWAMVGENGPELVRVNTSGKVYNSSQTSDLRKPNVNIVVNKNTGTNMRATSKESQDGQGRTITTVILQTVTNAMVTNE